MSLIDGIGDEVTHFFIGLLAVTIVTLAWWTTNIQDHRPVRTVLLLERRRRPNRRLTNHTQAVTITEGTSQAVPVSVESTTSVNEEPSTSETPESREKKPNVATVSTADSGDASQDSTEAQSIIETMDSDNCVLRQRRLAFYNSWNSENRDNPGAGATHLLELPHSSTDVEQEPLMEHNYAEHPNALEEESSTKPEQKVEKTVNDITIKLKYINDDVRLVQGKLNEPLGDFVKRHFQSELAANKLIRLIFNGHVLQPETETLASCGLFDNCVVHCLIHQKRSPSNESSAHNVPTEGYSFPNMGGTTNFNNNNQNREWDLGNFLFAFISFILLAAWYFRYVYAHLYTVTATVGLILITGIFTIVLVGMYFPENDHLPNPTIRIARERVQPQQ